MFSEKNISGKNREFGGSRAKYFSTWILSRSQTIKRRAVRKTFNDNASLWTTKTFLIAKNFDIVNDAEFREANEMFHAMLVQIKLAGKGSVTHKESISQEDFLKIKSSLDVNSPKGLQNKVFMDIMLHMCNRGRENLRDFSIKADFAIEVDS